MTASDHIASLRIEKDDFDYQPFHDKGRLTRAYQVFGDELDMVLKELNEALAA
jgi:type I restriction enzyme R subunit